MVYVSLRHAILVTNEGQRALVSLALSLRQEVHAVLLTLLIQADGVLLDEHGGAIVDPSRGGRGSRDYVVVFVKVGHLVLIFLLSAQFVHILILILKEHGCLRERAILSHDPDGGAQS